MKLKKNSMVSFVLSIFFAAGLFAVASTSVSAQEQGEKPDPNLARQAKITMAQARATAQKRASGKIEGAELEKENGKLLYSFDIRNSKGTVTEVQVDAKTGKLLSAKVESKKDEMKEKQQDEKQEKKKGKKT
ncbi:MAG: PepSY domain-containing protein [Pyrinomonadaceae bacterium]